MGYMCAKFSTFAKILIFFSQKRWTTTLTLHVHGPWCGGSTHMAQTRINFYSLLALFWADSLAQLSWLPSSQAVRVRFLQRAASNAGRTCVSLRTLWKAAERNCSGRWISYRGVASGSDRRRPAAGCPGEMRASRIRSWCIVTIFLLQNMTVRR